ncbi:hypothetical protein [Maricaulis sp.]|uniref:hypothetical protein n=1 Tax=Maricaulis sp. TaxID=1486257 RepID=UPI003A8F37CA
MISDILASIRGRVSWTAARPLMANCGVPIGQGWDKTIDRVLNESPTCDFEGLNQILLDSILCGNKYTRLHNLSVETRQAWQEAITELSLPSTKASEAFPKLLGANDLSELGTELVPVYVHHNEDGLGLVLTANYPMRRREQIPLNSLDGLSDRFDEVHGVVIGPVQVFAVLWIPHHRDQLELRVDYPKGMQQDDLLGLHGQLFTFAKSLGVSEIGSAIDLFPAVRRFYDDKNEGRVIEMNFVTTTGGQKNEKILRRMGTVDQRSETYHVGGSNALSDDIKIYRIHVEWLIVEDSSRFLPSLFLSAAGPSGTGPGGNPKITGATIGGCSRAAEYEFVIDKLGQKAQLTSSDL